MQPDPNKGPSRESWTSLLDGGHDFKTYGHTNASALLASIVGGHVTVVDELLASGANVNNADALGVTPLMASIAHGEDAIVDKLVASSASVNAVDNAGNNCIKVGTSSLNHLFNQHRNELITELLTFLALLFARATVCVCGTV